MFLLDKNKQREGLSLPCNDTIELIRIMLDYRGDTTINSVFFGNTSMLPVFKSDSTLKLYWISTDYVNYNNQLVTNQLSALYVISAMYYNDYRFCENIRLFDLSKKKYITNLKYYYQGVSDYHIVSDNQTIANIFKKTQLWYIELEKNGLNNMRKKNIPPPLLKNIRWDK
jgi:hypothetical protein